MRGTHLHRLLLTIATAVALVIFVHVCIAEVPTQDSTDQSTTAKVADSSASQSTPEELGDALVLHQRYEAAIAAYKKVPASATVLNKLGVTNQLMNNQEQAVRYYRAALKLDPNNATVINNLGTLYDSLRQFGDAEHMYRKALKLNPNSARIFKNLGNTLMAQQKYDKGWEAYQAALSIDPNVFGDTGSLRVQNSATVQERGAMNFYMAKGCLRTGDNDRAINYLRMALNEGFISPHKIQSDSEFASLHGNPAFEQLLAAQHKN